MVPCAHLAVEEWDSGDVSWDVSSDLSICCWTVKQKPNYLTLAHNGLEKSGGRVVAIHAEHTTLKSNVCLLMPCRIKMRTLTCWMVSICHTGDTILSVRNISVVWQRELPRKKKTIRSKILYKQMKKMRKEWRPCFFVRTSGYEHSFGCFRKINTAFNFKIRWNPQPRLRAVLFN